MLSAIVFRLNELLSAGLPSMGHVAELVGDTDSRFETARQSLLGTP